MEVAKGAVTSWKHLAGAFRQIGRTGWPPAAFQGFPRSPRRSPSSTTANSKAINLHLPSVGTLSLPTGRSKIEVARARPIHSAFY